MPIFPSQKVVFFDGVSENGGCVGTRNAFSTALWIQLKSFMLTS